jgi:hypothetical protein
VLNTSTAGHQWLTPVILATQEAEIRRIAVRSQPGQIVHKTLFPKTLHKKGLVEWLKVKVLTSSPSTGKKRQKNPHPQCCVVITTSRVFSALKMEALPPLTLTPQSPAPPC